MTRAAIEAAFKRNSHKGTMDLEGFIIAVEELTATHYAFKIKDKVKGLTVEECHYDKTFGAVYSVRDGAGSSFEMGEFELLTLKNDKR